MSIILEYLIYFAIIIFIAYTIYIIIPLIIKYYLKRRFNYKISKSDYAYLTFDDGPDPQTTIEVLNMLKEYNINATFFLTGKNAVKYSSVVNKILEMGHTIGEHSYEHTHAWHTGPLKTAKDLLRGKKIIEKYLVGKGKVLFRPPFGKMNFVTVLYVLIYQRKVSFWSIDAKDYLQKNKEEISSYILSGLKPGKVILLHDKNPNDSEMIGALKLILEYIKTSNMKFASLSDI